MSLTLVNKNGECVYCGAKLKPCADKSCGFLFFPKSKRHVYHSKSCNTRVLRERKKQREVIAKIRDELELDDE